MRYVISHCTGWRSPFDNILLTVAMPNLMTRVTFFWHFIIERTITATRFPITLLYAHLLQPLLLCDNRYIIHFFMSINKGDSEEKIHVNNSKWCDVTYNMRLLVTCDRYVKSHGENMSLLCHYHLQEMPPKYINI